MLSQPLCCILSHDLPGPEAVWRAGSCDPSQWALSQLREGATVGGDDPKIQKACQPKGRGVCVCIAYTYTHTHTHTHTLTHIQWVSLCMLYFSGVELPTSCCCEETVSEEESSSNCGWRSSLDRGAALVVYSVAVCVGGWVEIALYGDLTKPFIFKPYLAIHTIITVNQSFRGARYV